MVKKRNKIGFKNIISFLLALVVLVSTCTSKIFVVDTFADSNEIRKTMISFYEGNSITDVDKAALADAKTLRFLSLFASNFYVPFSTTFDDEDTNKTKDAIIKALINQCNFSQDTAETLVELIYQYTLSTAKPLFVDVSKDGYGDVFPTSKNSNFKLRGNSSSSSSSGNVSYSPNLNEDEKKALEALKDLENNAPIKTPGSNSLLAGKDLLKGTQDFQNLVDANGGDVSKALEAINKKQDQELMENIKNGNIKFEEIKKPTVKSSMSNDVTVEANDLPTLSLITGIATNRPSTPDSSSTSDSPSSSDSSSTSSVDYYSRSVRADLIPETTSIGGNSIGMQKTRLWNDTVLEAKMTDGKHFNCTGKKDLKVCSYGIFINLMAQMENAAIFWANDIKEAESKYKDKDFKKNHTVWNWNPDGYSAYPESGSWSKSGVKVKDLDKIATYGYTWKGDYPSKDSTMNSLESLVSIGSYLLCANTVNYQSGYGNAFIMYTLNSKTMNKLKINNDVKKTAKDANSDVWKVCSQTAPLYVDWVGNIICDTGYCRYLIVPACQNPYAWSTLSGENAAGSFINGCTLFALATPDSKNTSKPSLQYCNPTSKSSGTSHFSYTKGRVNLGYWVQLDNSEDKTLMKNNVWKQYVGSTSNSCDDGVFDKGKGTDLMNQMYALVTKTTKFDNKMYGSKSWLHAWKKAKIGSGYHDSNKDPGTSYFGMVTIGSDCDVATCKGISGSSDKSFIGKIPGFSTFLTIDGLGAYEGSDDDSYILDVDLLKQASNGDKNEGYGYPNYNSINIGKCDQASYDWAKNYLQGIYLTYLVAYCYAEEPPEEAIIDLKFESSRFPQETGTIDWAKVQESIDVKEQVQNKIISFINYLLDPLKGVGYIASWVKNKIGGLFLSWHSDIVGGSNSNASTGITPYLGFSSYTTLPNLYDIEWIASLLNAYNSIIIFLIVIIAVVLCCYVIVGSMTLQRGIFGVLIFGVIAFLPPIAITAVTDVSNRTSDAILSSKFEYWALVQHQTYLGEIYNASQSSNKDLYAMALMGTSVDNSNSVAGNVVGGYSGVKLKWMSPKKENYLANAAKELDKITSNDTLKSLFYNIATPQLSSQSFVDNSDALYLYRDYVDITNYAMKGYNLYSYWNGGGVANIADGDFKMAPYENWKSLESSQNLFTFAYKSGLTLREMVLRNNEKKYATDGYSKDDDLYGCTSIFALRSGFINNPTSLSASDLESTDNLDYYSPGNTSNLHLNFLLNFQQPYNRYIINFNRLEKLMSADIKSTHNGMIDLNQLQYFKGVVTGSGDKKLYSSFGLDPHNFSFGLANLKKDNGSEYTKSKIRYFYYGLYSESPYYYFNWVLQDNLNNSGLGYSYDGYKTSTTVKNYVNNVSKMLLADNQSFFYNYSPDAGDGYGELKDFMNMHDLFYYVYPILQDGSDLAEYFDKFFNIKMDEDMPLSIAADGNIRFTDGGNVIEVGDKDVNAGGTIAGDSSDDNSDDAASDTVESSDNNVMVLSWGEFKNYVETNNWTDEQISKFWHNYEVITILQAYTAWTDTMNDCSYANPERISHGNSTFLVEHPLDPTSYFSLDEDGKIVGGRYMVFSRSEMGFYGLKESDLTRVERKIIQIQDKVYEDCISLMNYSNFDDDVILSALAMDMLFAFNDIFSEESLVGDGHILYPTGYELKAFTYDAYMRLILSEATGENLMSKETNSDGLEVSGNIYNTILRKTSIFFAIFLVFLDIIVTYVIPLMRLLFLLFIFLLSIVVIASEAFKLELNIVKVTWKALLAPLICFGTVSVGLSWINSLFMSNGNEDVIKGKTTISLGDPTMTIIAMLLLNICVVILYWKILSTTFKNLKKFISALATNVAGNVVGAVGKIAGGIVAGGALGAAMGRVRGLSGASRGLSGLGKGKGGSGSGNAYSSADQRGKDNTGGSPKPIVKDKVEEEALKAKESNKTDTSDKKSSGNKYDEKVENPNKEINSENVFGGLKASGIYSKTTNAQNRELNNKYNSMVTRNNRVQSAYKDNEQYNNLMDAGIKLNRSQRKEVKKNNKQILYGGMGNRNILTKEGRHNVFSKEGRNTRRLVKSGVNVGAANEAKLQRYANMAPDKPAKKISNTVSNKAQVSKVKKTIKISNKAGKRKNSAHKKPKAKAQKKRK